MHGNFPEIPDADLLLIAGDICPFYSFGVSLSFLQSHWLIHKFAPWLESLPMPVVGIAGNHDFLFQHAPHLVPKLPWTYLQDQAADFNGVKIYGSPWQLRHHDWAFNLDEPDLEKKWQAIPSDTDIFLLHNPPYGYGDKVPRRINDSNETEWPDGDHKGSPSLLKRIEEVRPKLVVYGHIHNGYGKYDHQGIPLVNAAVVGRNRQLANPPIIVEV